MKKTISFLNQYDRYVILTHVKADGDALGSAIAMHEALRLCRKKSVIVAAERPSGNLKFLDAYYNWENRDIKDPQAVICVDSSDIFRVIDRLEQYGGLPVLNIDHHKSNTYFGDENLVAPGLSSAGELIFDLLTQWGVSINEKIASALYVAIVTDTGRFMYSSTTEKTLRIAAKLMSAGIDTQAILQELYSNNSLNKLRLEAYAVENAKLYFEDRCIVSVLTREDQKRFDCSETDDIVEKLRDIKGIQISALIYEYNGRTNVSLRSKGKYDVSILAQKMGGGGHKNAAGANSENSVEKTYSTLIELLGEVLHV